MTRESAAVLPDQERRDRRVGDKDELAAREAGWQAYLAELAALGEVAPNSPTSPREAYVRSLAVYRREIATNALRRMGAGR